MNRPRRIFPAVRSLRPSTAFLNGLRPASPVTPALYCLESCFHKTRSRFPLECWRRFVSVVASLCLVDISLCLPSQNPTPPKLESPCPSHVNADHGDPLTLPPAASTFTPSPLSSRTFSALCRPLTPHLHIGRVSMASSRRTRSYKTEKARGFATGLLLGRQVVRPKPEGSMRECLVRKVHLLPSKAADASIGRDDAVARHPWRKRVVPQGVPHGTRRRR